MKRLLIVLAAVAVLASCAGVERKCVEEALDSNRSLRGNVQKLDSIALDLEKFLTTRGDSLSDEGYEWLDDCQQKVTVQASLFETEATRITLEEMRFLSGMKDSLFTSNIKRCLNR